MLQKEFWSEVEFSVVEVISVMGDTFAAPVLLKVLLLSWTTGVCVPFM